MSYFLAAVGDTANRDICRFDEVFRETVPRKIRNQRRMLAAPRSALVVYGTEKPIKDLVIQEAGGGSWLALLGTPLMTLTCRNTPQEILGRFGENPRRFLTHDLDGCFAAMYCDAAARTMLIASDYNNTTPVYYARRNGTLYLSSHELALARYLRADIEPAGFAQTIQLRLTWGTLCRFKGITKTVPCQIVTFDQDGTAGADFYWHPSEEEPWQDDFDGTLERWSAILEDSVKAYHDCSSNKNVICDFTAGEDSRLLLAQCHALNIPFTAQVTGGDSSTDVRVAREAAKRIGFDVRVHGAHSISEQQLRENATYVALMNDGYEDYFESCSFFANDEADPVLYYDFVKYCGAPGGEAFRGSYYARGKAFRPSAHRRVDTPFFVRMKYLLDFQPGLMRFPDEEWKQIICRIAEGAVDEVAGFPVGTQVDHLVRVFQTCNIGLIYKNPLYNPLASREMTRSIYGMSPRFKRGGRLTKACTERLFPELAVVKTQNGVPTIRRTVLRFHRFLPEHVAFVRRVSRGAFRRLLKVAASDRPAYSWKENAAAIAVLTREEPYSAWFSSPASMVTGHLYKSDALAAILNEAKAGGTRNLPTLGRIIGQELACRWVYGLSA